MRHIVVTEFMSLDGVIEAPAWSAPYWNDEISKFKAEEQESSDSLLLGRVTYEGFAAAWPESTEDGADFMNSIPKYVVSTTLDSAAWNNSTLIGENIAENVANLKSQDGRDILVYGSAKLVQTLTEHGLVDQYRLLVYPVVVGTGKRLFGEGIPATLKLVSSQSFGSGVMGLVYEAEGK